MSQGLTPGDGYHGISASTQGLAESRSADVRPQRPPHEGGRDWPSGGTILRILAVGLVAIVLLGWLLSALNG